jgi:hypothetical protein
MKDTRLGSRIIRDEGLGWPHVIVARDDDTITLSPLDKIMEAGEAVQADSADVILLPAKVLDIPGSLSDLISDRALGTVVFFKVLVGGRKDGMLRSYILTVTPEAAATIAAALSCNNISA